MSQIFETFKNHYFCNTNAFRILHLQTRELCELGLPEKKNIEASGTVHVHIIMACSWTQFCVFKVAWPVWVDTTWHVLSSWSNIYSPVPGHSFVFSRWRGLFLDTCVFEVAWPVCGYMLPDMYFWIGLMLTCLFLETVLCMACSGMHLCTFEVAWVQHIFCLYSFFVRIK